MYNKRRFGRHLRTYIDHASSHGSDKTLITFTFFKRNNDKRCDRNDSLDIMKELVQCRMKYGHLK